jgi:O-antigen ligase
VIRVVKKNIIVYMIILDVFAILTLGKGLGGSGLGGEIEESVYLLGNKFVVSYLHMVVLAFINQVEGKTFSNRKKLRRVILFLLYSLFICKLIDTTTGMVGCLVVAMILIISIYCPRVIRLMWDPRVVLIFFFGINAIFLLTDYVLGNSSLTSFFLARSHTNTILSGRVIMYKISMEAIAKNPIWGYGLNCEVVLEKLSYGNAQNGLLKMLLDQGVVGTVLFAFVLFSTFSNAKKSKDPKNTVGSIAFIYAMLFCSLVEINLASTFMLICALLNGASADNCFVGKEGCFRNEN